MKTRLLVLLLLVSAAVGTRSWFGVSAAAPQREQLSVFPATLGSWHAMGDARLDDDVMSVLKADDYLLRRYSDGTSSADLFVAYYQKQRAGESMHSPKNCLPGSGWTVVSSDIVPLRPGTDWPKVNRYILEKAGERILAVYWYQESGRVIASEYAGKAYLVWDAMRTHRRDGAIIRVDVALPKGQEKAAETKAFALAAAVQPQLSNFVPN